MIEFQTEVSLYVVRSGPNGPGPHIRRTHYNRPDRYNFFREVRNFQCEGVGHPLTWTWPSGYGVASADVTSITVLTPDGRRRRDPEVELQQARYNEPLNFVRDFTAPAYITPPPLTTTVNPFDDYRRDRLAARQAANQTAAESGWRYFLQACDEETREHYMALVSMDGCTCNDCANAAADVLAEDDYAIPMARWEIDLLAWPIHIPEEQRDEGPDPTPGRTRLREVARASSPPSVRVRDWFPSVEVPDEDEPF